MNLIFWLQESLNKIFFIYLFFSVVFNSHFSSPLICCVSYKHFNLLKIFYLFLVFLVLGVHLSFFFKLSIYLWLCWVFITLSFSLVVASGGYIQLQCAGFSLQGFLLLSNVHSVVTAPGLQNTGSGVGARAQLLSSMWDLPGPGMEPKSPALADRFFTTEPPGKPLHQSFLRNYFKPTFFSITPT